MNVLESIARLVDESLKDKGSTVVYNNLLEIRRLIDLELSPKRPRSTVVDDYTKWYRENREKKDGEGTS